MVPLPQFLVLSLIASVCLLQVPSSSCARISSRLNNGSSVDGSSLSSNNNNNNNMNTTNSAPFPVPLRRLSSSKPASKGTTTSRLRNASTTNNPTANAPATQTPSTTKPNTTKPNSSRRPNAATVAPPSTNPITITQEQPTCDDNPLEEEPPSTLSPSDQQQPPPTGSPMKDAPSAVTATMGSTTTIPTAVPTTTALVIVATTTVPTQDQIQLEQHQEQPNTNTNTNPNTTTITKAGFQRLAAIVMASFVAAISGALVVLGFRYRKAGSNRRSWLEESPASNSTPLM